ncbi:signal peptidase I [Catenulispora acidiphila DSM 44928]|uniref:Signal peptidase I n=1 Tax=Catenulispora acidiphila (strain DSM 44928 / JCM 14897 / NBRC 102108 / NRRL B-24433 / ID139908) TaxID=479433 RepID=C7QDR6_CATAD|nr:signal peptidase I [Catenulispora acidiphila]ACU74690.1 signal peptidase I [Catenulispora acidiphila DSM 44928]
MSRSGHAALVAAAGMALAAALIARRRFTVVVVAGASMNPTYQDGDRLLVRRGGQRPERRAVVVFRTPPQIGATELRWLVKRVVAVPGDPVPRDVRRAAGGAAVVPPGRLVVRGDNPHSVDSRRFGFVAAADVLGVAAKRLDHLER